MRGWMLRALCAMLLATPFVEAAEVRFVPAEGATDMVYDSRRDIVYIAHGDRITRYRLGTGRFLAPIRLGDGAAARGIDLSPDEALLAVADTASSQSQGWVHLVDLGTMSHTKAAFLKADSYEAGTHSVAFAADGALLATSRFSGSGWVPMRRRSPEGDWSVLTSVRQDTMLSASGDRQTIAFAEANISDGRWGLYDVPTGGLVRRQWYEDGTSWFNYEIATDRLGAHFAIPTYGGTYLYGPEYQELGVIGTYAGPQPVGVAYHPVEQQLFFPWSGTGEVLVFDALERELEDIVPISEDVLFDQNGNAAYGAGRTRLSADGSLLMVTVPGGVAIARMYAPLAAADVAAGTEAGRPVGIPLAGSIGNGGTLRYELYRTPRHGRARVYGNRIRYVPAAGFTGTDTFYYTAHYGLDVVAGQVTVTVAPR